DPAERAGQVRGPAGGDGEEPGDADVSGQLAEHRAGFCRCEAGTRVSGAVWTGPVRGAAADAAESAGEGCAEGPRAERELRARVDGTAHAGRQRWLYAGGRDSGGESVHRMDDRATGAWRGFPVRRAAA